MGMIFKCKKGVAFNFNEKKVLVKCPKNCPKRLLCNQEYAVGKWVTSTALTALEPIYEDKPSDNIADDARRNSIASEAPREALEIEPSLAKEPIEAASSDKQEAKEEKERPISNIRARLGGTKAKRVSSEYEGLEASEDVIIYVGSNEYYAPAYAKGHGLKGIDEALYDIFIHWYTDLCFSYDGSLIDAFKNALKLKYLDKYKDIEADLANYSDPNIKFFHLYYDHIYKNMPITNCFYFERANKHTNIAPMLQSPDSLYINIYNDPAYLKSFIGIEAELLSYMHMPSMNSILELCVKYLNEKYDCVAYFTTAYDESLVPYKRLLILDTSTKHFIEHLADVTGYMEMDNKLSFLREYSISKQGVIASRRTALNEDDIAGRVDDSIYSILGIYDISSSQSKDYLKKYLILAKEYMNITKPRSMNFKAFTLTSSNFYSEILEIVNNAYSRCVDGASGSNDLKAYYLLYTLKENGLLDDFIDSCMTSKKDEVLRLLRDRLDYEDYLSSSIEGKMVYLDNKRYTIDEYIGYLIDNADIKHINEALENDKIYKLLASDKNLADGDIKNINKKLVSMTKGLGE